MLTIAAYTATYDRAMRPSAPRVGSLFRMSDSPDAREYDGFRATLIAAGLDWEYVRRMPRLALDVCRVIRA